MKFRRLICALLVVCALATTVGAQASTFERVWMVYEDYSGNRVEQVVEDAALLDEVEAIMRRVAGNPTPFKECTLNCTLFCLTLNGDIYDFACATDGNSIIQNRETDLCYSLGDDYQRFWEIFSTVRDGMGYEASAVFGW